MQIPDLKKVGIISGGNKKSKEVVLFEKNYGKKTKNNINKEGIGSIMVERKVYFLSVA